MSTNTKISHPIRSISSYESCSEKLFTSPVSSPTQSSRSSSSLSSSSATPAEGCGGSPQIHIRLKDNIIAYIEENRPFDYFHYPVESVAFWNIWCDSEDEEILEGRSVIYNPKTLTLQIKGMSAGHHENGAKWCRSGYRAMLADGFVATADSAECTLEITASQVGLIQEPENKMYTGFDESSAWKDMARTPDWSIMRICDDVELEKPLIVLITGVSQKFSKSNSLTNKRESLQDRAEAWLSASYGITKAVILIDIKDNVASSNDTINPDLTELQLPGLSLRVKVQLWRNHPSTKAPCIVEYYTFIVARDDRMWVNKSEIPDDFPLGITLLSTDIYDSPEENKSFLLPMWSLRNRVIDTWPLHISAVAKRKNALRSKGEIKRSGQE